MVEKEEPKVYKFSALNKKENKVDNQDENEEEYDETPASIEDFDFSDDEVPKKWLKIIIIFIYLFKSNIGKSFFLFSVFLFN